MRGWLESIAWRSVVPLRPTPTMKNNPSARVSFVTMCGIVVLHCRGLNRIRE